ncbi:hypothetical protein F751_0332 [Auxenochlorella protothecoides]|uniref:Uncharacterized protein n=1 Tax=Auxenochlorella protothecoides TaxID=3075 RepID=A0A087SB70_AUXPR|nr:hypothetical protein F751_0332 [Auxenochlorella protothecoides]KFM22974.1 hypothetical protein F751_0332 [Auxenochlorella protothecoides]
MALLERQDQATFDGSSKAKSKTRRAKSKKIVRLRLEEVYWQGLLADQTAARAFFSDATRREDVLRFLTGGPSCAYGLLCTSSMQLRLVILSLIERDSRLMLVGASSDTVRAFYEAVRDASWRHLSLPPSLAPAGQLSAADVAGLRRATLGALGAMLVVGLIERDSRLMLVGASSDTVRAFYEAVRDASWRHLSLPPSLAPAGQLSAADVAGLRRATLGALGAMLVVGDAVTIDTRLFRTHVQFLLNLLTAVTSDGWEVAAAAEALGLVILSLIERDSRLMLVGASSDTVRAFYEAVRDASWRHLSLPPSLAPAGQLSAADVAGLRRATLGALGAMLVVGDAVTIDTRLFRTHVQFLLNLLTAVTSDGWEVAAAAEALGALESTYPGLLMEAGWYLAERVESAAAAEGPLTPAQNGEVSLAALVLSHAAGMYNEQQRGRVPPLLSAADLAAAPGTLPPSPSEAEWETPSPPAAGLGSLLLPEYGAASQTLELHLLERKGRELLRRFRVPAHLTPGGGEAGATGEAAAAARRELGEATLCLLRLLAVVANPEALRARLPPLLAASAVPDAALRRAFFPLLRAPTLGTALALHDAAPARFARCAPELVRRVLRALASPARGEEDRLALALHVAALHAAATRPAGWQLVRPTLEWLGCEEGAAGAKGGDDGAAKHPSLLAAQTVPAFFAAAEAELRWAASPTTWAEAARVACTRDPLAVRHLALAGGLPPAALRWYASYFGAYRRETEAHELSAAATGAAALALCHAALLRCDGKVDECEDGDVAGVEVADVGRARAKAGGSAAGPRGTRDEQGAALDALLRALEARFPDGSVRERAAGLRSLRDSAAVMGAAVVPTAMQDGIVDWYIRSALGQR